MNRHGEETITVCVVQGADGPYIDRVDAPRLLSEHDAAQALGPHSIFASSMRRSGPVLPQQRLESLATQLAKAPGVTPDVPAVTPDSAPDHVQVAAELIKDFMTHAFGKEQAPALPSAVAASAPAFSVEPLQQPAPRSAEVERVAPLQAGMLPQMPFNFDGIKLERRSLFASRRARLGLVAAGVVLAAGVGAYAFHDIFTGGNAASISGKALNLPDVLHGMTDCTPAKPLQLTGQGFMQWQYDKTKDYWYPGSAKNSAQDNNLTAPVDLTNTFKSEICFVGTNAVTLNRSGKTVDVQLHLNKMLLAGTFSQPDFSYRAPMINESLITSESEISLANAKNINVAVDPKTGQKEVDALATFAVMQAVDKNCQQQLAQTAVESKIAAIKSQTAKQGVTANVTVSGALTSLAQSYKNSHGISAVYVVPKKKPGATLDPIPYIRNKDTTALLTNVTSSCKLKD